MVTIEQKISLFSKLLHRSMNEKFSEEMERLKREYEEKLQKSKDAADKEAEDILNRARKKAEAEKVELISKERINLKKEYMAVKEKYFAVFMEHLLKRINTFILSDKYYDYLLSLVRKLIQSEQFGGSLIIYLTAGDFEKYATGIRQELARHFGGDIAVRTADTDILGGFIAVEPESYIRIDFTLSSLLEDNKSYIMQTLFQAIEAGEADGI